MITKALSFGLLGIEAYPVEIEIDVSRGLPTITVVGLADTAIRESKERVKSAIKNSGFEWLGERITVNLAPSDIKKEGASFDLAITLGILAATAQLNPKSLEEYFIIGELSLDGTLRPTRGILPISIAAAKCRPRKIIVPIQNAKEAAMVPEVRVQPLQSLKEAVQFLNNQNDYLPFKLDLKNQLTENAHYEVDFSDVKGQYLAKRALEIAVSGGHNILMLWTQCYKGKSFPKDEEELLRGS